MKGAKEDHHKGGVEMEDNEISSEDGPQDRPIVNRDIKGAKASLRKALHSLKFNGYQKWLNHNPNDAAEDHIKDAIRKLDGKNMRR